ncbi:MAG: 50S ribosomal protein L4 [Acholeplasmataceae bacterium]|nr:50S ribosomal protein L4 [Acholeplasmataceae bacterium]
MPTFELMNLSGSKVADVTLSDYVFGIEPHKQALFDVINAQRAAMRQGTHDVKNRGEIRGGGRKPWRQKGTGRARQGSIRSPQWRGGGVVFGPTPRSYAVKINQKVRQLALRSALSHHVVLGQFKLVETVAIEDAKTKVFTKFLKDLGVEGKTIVVATTFTEEAVRAARNLPNVAFALAGHVSVYDLLNNRNLIITKDAAEYFEEVLGND